MEGAWQYLPTTFGIVTTLKLLYFFSIWIHQFHTVLPIKYFHCLKYWIMILPFSLLEGTFPPRWFGAFSSKAPIPSILHFPIFQLNEWTISSCAPIWRKMEAVIFPFGLIPQCVKEAESSSLAYWEKSIRLKLSCKGAGEIVEIFGYGFMNRLSFFIFYFSILLTRISIMVTDYCGGRCSKFYVMTIG